MGNPDHGVRFPSPKRCQRETLAKRSESIPGARRPYAVQVPVPDFLVIDPEHGPKRCVRDPNHEIRISTEGREALRNPLFTPDIGFESMGGGGIF